MPLSDTPDLQDPFHRALYNKLAGEIQKRMVNLASGSLLGLTPEMGRTTADKYAEEVGYMKGLQDALDVAEEIAKERFGERPTA